MDFIGPYRSNFACTPLTPLPSGPRKGSGKLEPYVPFFVELMEQDPDITLAELQAALLTAHGVACSTSGIYCRASTTLSARDNHLGRISGR